MKIGINGLGRIGRQVFRIASHHSGLELVHVNDLADAETLAYLLQYDTNYGSWDREIRGEGDTLYVDNATVSVSAQSDPAKLPWGEKDVDVVLESTGLFRRKVDAALHLQAGAKKVLISAPGESFLDGEFVIGVNDDLYDRKHHEIISVSSCTTNCLAPLAKVLHDAFTIEQGMINTAHAYTSSQKLVDGPHGNPRRGRSAAENLIPTTTEAATAIDLILPELSRKFSGLAVRAPVKSGSLLDLTCALGKSTTAEEVNEVFRQAAQGAMKGILGVNDRPLVSSDIIGSTQSAMVSTTDTIVIGGTLVKVLAWYDNEWAFAQRCTDMMAKMM